MKTALTIAGSDCSGGAGIQADLKTMTVFGVYGMSAITALTAQNTMGIRSVSVVSPVLLEQQLRAVFEDIRPDAVKIGLLGSEDNVCITAKLLEEYHAENIVLDPVLASTGGVSFLEREEMKRLLMEKLFPLASLVTPNLPEAEQLTGIRLSSTAAREQAAEWLYSRFGCGVLLKGGHGEEGADDFLLADGIREWFTSERIWNPNTHGTGCTLSSAIAAGLAKQYDLSRAVQEGKTYVTGAIRAGLCLGKGNGPLNHTFSFSSSS